MLFFCYLAKNCIFESKAKAKAREKSDQIPEKQPDRLLLCMIGNSWKCL